MLKKIKLVIKIVLLVAFISTFFYGYQYHSKSKINKDIEVVTNKWVSMKNI